MAILAAPDTMAMETSPSCLLCLLLCRLASLGSGRGVNIHRRSTNPMHVCLQETSRSSASASQVHVYRFPDILRVIDKSFVDHSQLLLEFLQARHHVYGGRK